MFFLVFQLLPLAIYLLLLGTINRRRRPLIVPGPWDFAGVLFAASGFLLLGGPGALSVLNDRWRDALVYGENPSSSTATAESLWGWWLVLTATYFVVIVVAAGFFLWRSRHLTSIYNVDLETIQTTMDRIFARLGLRPLRTGNMYYFGVTNRPRSEDRAAPSLEAQRIQTTPAETETSLKVQTAPTPVVSKQNVILEVDAFRFMWHVTLRWEPAHSGLRQEIERELDSELAETPSPFHALSGWLTLAGCGTFLLMLLMGISVLIFRIVNHIL